MKRLAVLAAAVCLTAAAGCGQARKLTATTPTPAAGAVLASLRQKTSAARTARIAFSAQADIHGLPGAMSAPFALSGSGAVDLQANRGSIHLDFSGMSSPEASGLPGGLTSGDVVFDGTTVYLRLPATLAGKGKPWARISPSSLFGSASGNGSGPFGAGLFGLGDPTRSLGMLDGLGVTATVVAHDTVRGQATTHYRTTIDLGKASGAPGATPTALSGFPFPTALPADVWVDGQGRLARVTVTLDFTKAFAGMMAGFAAGLNGGTPGAVPTPAPSGFSFIDTSTYEAYDYGTPVTVTIPPPDQVEDGANLPDLGLGMSGP